MSLEVDHINPKHYKRYSIKVIDMMIRIWGEEATILYCEMNAFKYRMRAGIKAGQPAPRDLNKESWYLEKANQLRQNPKTNSDEC